jgi:phosphoserine phosphatase RsbU/P
MSDESRQIEKLRRILDVARQMADTTDLNALLHTIVSATCQVLDCERATIFLYEAATNELYSRVATGAEVIRFPATRGIAGTAAQQRTLVNVPDAYADPRFNPEIDKQTGFRTRNLLTFPLESYSGELMGVLQALNKVAGPFGAEDEDLARVLSAQAGVALHRWRLLEEYAEKQRMARDLEIARSIQQSLFPKEDPVVPGYEVTGWSRPADETGGDCYDFIPLDDGRLAVFLADATGHGIGSALVIAQCRALLRAMLSVATDIATVATRVNRLLAQDLHGDRFVTAFIGVLDPREHRLDYVSAGQGPILWILKAATEVRSASGLPLAVIADMKYAGVRLDFSPGDTLALLTDGFYEASAHDEQFGDDRVLEVLRQHAGQPVADIIAPLYQAVCDFTGGGVQADDLTAVLVRRNA